MNMLIAEELLLLLLDDEKGTLPPGTPVQPALGGAVLVELALAGAVTVDRRGRAWRSARVHAVPGAGVADPVLADALVTVAGKERSAQDLVTRLGKGLMKRLAQRLADRGVLERRTGRALGLLARTRWVAIDTGHEARVRESLTAALVQGVEPDQRTAALVALLNAISRAHKTVDHRGMPSREVRRRAKQIAEGSWAAQAVKDAVDASMAAIVAAIAASGAAAS